MTPGEVRFEIHGVIPSLGNERYGHWAARHRLQRGWREITWAQAQAARGRAGWERPARREEVPRRVSITFVRPRLLDTDNLYRTAKPVVDGLKGVLILDDSPDHALVTVRQERAAGRRPHMLVRVERGAPPPAGEAPS